MHAPLPQKRPSMPARPMPLFQADIHLHRARLFHDRAALEAAAALIRKHGYKRRLPELEDAQRDAVHWPTLVIPL